MAARHYEFFDEGFLARLQGLHLIAKQLAARGSAGVRRSRGMGDGLEFADHRDYSPGDEPRFIDWPYYARMERLLLRLFHEHSEAGVAILLDSSASMAPGGGMEKFHYALRAVAALAYVAMGSLERVTVAPFAEELGEPLRTGRNRGRIFQVLDYLAALRPQGKTRLKNCVEALLRKRESFGTAILVSDLLDASADLPDALARLRQGGREVAVLHIYSPADASPDLAGAMLLRQAESGQDLSLEVTEDLLESYRRQWASFQDHCRRECFGRGIAYVAAPVSLPFDRLVLQALRQAGVLAG